MKWNVERERERLQGAETQFFAYVKSEFLKSNIVETSNEAQRGILRCYQANVSALNYYFMSGALSIESINIDLGWKGTHQNRAAAVCTIIATESFSHELKFLFEKFPTEKFNLRFTSSTENVFVIFQMKFA